jgi:hypothetical protein
MAAKEKGSRVSFGCFQAQQRAIVMPRRGWKAARPPIVMEWIRTVRIMLRTVP